jgi:hypothetical protein
MNIQSIKKMMFLGLGLSFSSVALAGGENKSFPSLKELAERKILQDQNPCPPTDSNTPNLLTN